jgi:hypothetical protein
MHDRPLIEPVHVGTVGGQPLRFFRSPLADGRPDLPWHSVGDLHDCLGLNRAMRKVVYKKLRKRKLQQRVATAHGGAVIAPHVVALALIETLVEIGMAQPAIRAEYARARNQALRKLIPPPLFGSAWFAWMTTALACWEGAPDAGGRDA